ncbi:MAG: hypothetical protein Tsb009_32810 [Planctomycetaceae bacterium]
MSRNSFRPIILSFAICTVAVSAQRTFADDDVARQIQIIAQAGPNGAGSRAAAKARDRLLKQGPEILPQLLKAMDTANIVAANWYRSVFEQLVSRELAAKEPKLPVSDFKRYIENPKHQGRLRRRLLSLMNELELDYRVQLLPKLLDDPEFRNDAVDHALEKGAVALKRGNKTEARRQYLAAFHHARNARQITRAADRLNVLGEKVSIIKQMGFVTDWYLLGPFDAPGKTGFDTSFPPEKKVDLSATYPGKNGITIRWKRSQKTDRLGQLNLIQSIASVKEAVGYAYTELDSKSEQSVELRCGADDNLTVWLNGKKVFSRLQWLNGTRLDRFSASVKLKKGRNRLLVKICQGPQHKNPAVPNNWSMQLRFCAKDGKGVDLKSLLPSVKNQEGQ